MQKQTRWAMAAAAALLAGAGMVHAGTLYVDFGTRSGSATGLRDGGAATWNVRTDAQVTTTVNNLADGSGKATAIDISAMTGFTLVRGLLWDLNPAPPNWCVNNAIEDGYKGDNTSPTVTFSDLTPGVDYTFEVASTAESPGDEYNQNFRLVGLTTTGWVNYHGYTHAVQGNQTRTLGPVKPDATGKIVLEITYPSGGRFTYLAAVKLTWPPPPKGTVIIVK
jgi:hypothetical protein